MYYSHLIDRSSSFQGPAAKDRILMKRANHTYQKSLIYMIGVIIQRVKKDQIDRGDRVQRTQVGQLVNHIPDRPDLCLFIFSFHLVQILSSQQDRPDLTLYRVTDTGVVRLCQGGLCSLRHFTPFSLPGLPRFLIFTDFYGFFTDVLIFSLS